LPIFFLYSLFNLRDDVISPIVIHGSLITRDAGITIVFSGASVFMISLRVFENAA
jgi:hypothetical protein